MIADWNLLSRFLPCIYLAHRWLGVLTNILGLGTFALIGWLVWLFQRLRTDLSRWEDEATRANEAKHLAEEVARHAEHRVALAEREAIREKRLLEEIKSSATSDQDALRAELTQVQAQLGSIEAKLDQAVFVMVYSPLLSRH